MPTSYTRLPDPELAPDIYQDVNTKRLIAWFVDCLITIILTLVALPFTLFLGLFFFPFLWAVISIVYRAATLSRYSATLGMRFVSIELRRDSGAKFDLGTAIVHTLLYSLAIASMVLQIVSVGLMLAGKRSKGLPDHLLGTVAINHTVRY